jgi:hypothetical protein
VQERELDLARLGLLAQAINGHWSFLRFAGAQWIFDELTILCLSLNVLMATWWFKTAINIKFTIKLVTSWTRSRCNSGVEFSWRIFETKQHEPTMTQVVNLDARWRELSTARRGFAYTDAKVLFDRLDCLATRVPKMWAVTCHHSQTRARPWHQLLFSYASMNWQFRRSHCGL